MPKNLGLDENSLAADDFFALEVCDDNLWTPDNPLLGNLENKNQQPTVQLSLYYCISPLPTKKKVLVFFGLALLQPHIFRAISCFGEAHS